MKSKRERLDAFERLLFAAGRRLEAVTPSAVWQGAVMGDIRRLALRGAGDTGSAFIGRFAWRVSAVAAGVALVLLAYAMSRGFIDYEELAMRFLDDPASFLI